MKKKPNITDEERAIFKEYTKGVKPLDPNLRHKHVSKEKKSPKPRFTPRQPDSAATLEGYFPELPILWLTFEHGGHGVFVVNKQQLQELA